jgi:aminocarboxymuconate-semialdehyde decarboxylase
MYGSDYPCWDPATALALIDELQLSDTDREKLFVGNARRFFRLADFVMPGVQQSSLAGALV